MLGKSQLATSLCGWVSSLLRVLVVISYSCKPFFPLLFDALLSQPQLGLSNSSLELVLPIFSLASLASLSSVQLISSPLSASHQQLLERPKVKKSAYGLCHNLERHTRCC